MKKKEPDRAKVELPNIRIEVTELLGILERISGGKYPITGETSDIIFESVEDMMIHLAECAQVNSIKIGPVVFDTGRRWRDSPTLSIDLSKWQIMDVDYNADEARILMKSLEQELIPFKKWLARPAVRRVPNFFLMVIVVFWLLPITLVNDLLPLVTVLPPLVPEALYRTSMISFIPVFVIWVFAVEPILKKAIGENAVYHQPRETWYQRHSGQIFVGAITAVCGAVATFFLT